MLISDANRVRGVFFDRRFCGGLPGGIERPEEVLGSSNCTLVAPSADLRPSSLSNPCEQRFYSQVLWCGNQKGLADDRRQTIDRCHVRASY